MKIRFSYLVLALACIAAVGCSKDSSAPVSSNSGPSASSPVAQNNTPQGTPEAGTNPATPGTKPGAEPTTKPGEAPTMTEALKAGVAKTNEVQRQLNEPIDKADPNWKPASITAKDLGAKTSNAIGSLKDTLALMRIFVETPMGIGRFEKYTKVRDKDHFNVFFVVLRDDPFSGGVIANGAGKKTRMDTEVSSEIPMDQPVLNVKGEIGQTWPTSFPSLMFKSLVDRKDAWTPFLTQLEKNGYKTTIQQRTLIQQGRTFKHYRVVAERAANPTKKLLKSSIEIVIDGNRFLPNSIKSMNVDKNNKKWNIEWNGFYKFNQKFTEKDFSEFDSGMQPGPIS